MRHFTLSVLLFCCSLASSQDIAIVKANKLIEDKKYESALKILNEADPGNQNPDIVMAKTDLLLNYFTKSIMHKLFGLKDLEPDENLMEPRKGQGKFAMFMFEPDSILNKLIILYPDNYKDK